MPEISIIIPVYKVGKYLRRCVDSILAQTFTDFELLLIDDGSPDRSGAICDEYAAKDSRVRVFHKENGGVSSARNVGLLAASGKYIAFVDSDDYIAPELYLSVYSQSNRQDIIFFHYTVVKEGTYTKIFQTDLNNLSKDSREYMRLYMMSQGTNRNKTFFDESISVFCWRALYRHEYLLKNNIKFDENIRTGEDRIFLQTLLLYSPKIQVNNTQFGYFYCIRGEESLTAQKDLAKYIPDLYEQLKLFDTLEQNICKHTSFLSDRDLLEIRMQRCTKMRYRVILNEFKYHPAGAISVIKNIRNDEFFKTAVSFDSLKYAIKKRDRMDVLKILLIKFRLYRCILFIYKNPFYKKS